MCHPFGWRWRDLLNSQFGTECASCRVRGFHFVLSERTERAKFRARRRLLRGRPRVLGSAEQRDELTPFQVIELHSIAYGPGSPRRISSWQGSVTEHKEDISKISGLEVACLASDSS
jgi:hypothetical protein